MGLRFALSYAAIAGLLFAVYAFPFELFGARQDWLEGYLRTYAQVAGGLLGLVEPNIVIEGTVIRGRFPLQIVRNCDAADVKILLASAVLAFPAPLARKVLPLLFGLVALASANVLRIASLYYVGVHRPGWFRVAHEEVWPLLLVAFTAALFLVCLGRVAVEERAK